MSRPRTPIRILGVACTTHGFAFVTTEGPDRILDWGKYTFTSHPQAVRALGIVISRSQPLFVACEFERNEKKSERGRVFNAALASVCDEHGIMILCAERKMRGSGSRASTNQEIAELIAAHFPLLAHKLPKRRRIWSGVDDRIGILLAVSSAVAGWTYFSRRPSQPAQNDVCLDDTSDATI